MKNIKKSPFEILGLLDNFSNDDIKSRYLELIRKNPPEKNPEMFMKIREAYELIIKPDLMPNSFPMYFKPLSLFENKKNEEDFELTRGVLKEIFETPFSPEFELKELFKPMKFRS
ncbi:MAG: J domain-containing protein [Bacteroidales bacterium]|nr:J domain-containing protein [Bacteroidales bacterium]